MFPPNRLTFTIPEEAYRERAEGEVAQPSSHPAEEDVVNAIDAINRRSADIRTFHDQSELQDPGRIARNALIKLAIKKCGLEQKYPTLASYNSSSSTEDKLVVAKTAKRYGDNINAYYNGDATAEKGDIQSVMDTYSSKLNTEPSSVDDVFATLKQVYEGNLSLPPVQKALSAMIYDKFAGAFILNNASVVASIQSGDRLRINLRDRNEVKR